MPPPSFPDQREHELAAICDYLTFAASHHQVVTGGQVSTAARVSKTRLPQLLDEVNRRAHDWGHPLLGAIVSDGGDLRPSPSFVRAARSFAPAYGAPDLAQWRTERDRVWAYRWGTPTTVVNRHTM